MGMVVVRMLAMEGNFCMALASARRGNTEATVASVWGKLRIRAPLGPSEVRECAGSEQLQKAKGPRRRPVRWEASS